MNLSTVAAVMTAGPVTVGLSATFKEIAENMAAHRISAVGVTDAEGVLAGVVSEADLLAHYRVWPKRWHRLVHRAERRKTAARIAAELMSAPVLTVEAGDSLTTAAARFAETGVRRLFVVRDGKPVGVLARHDLVSVFARDDGEIRHEIENTVLWGEFSLGPDRVRVLVESGVVTVAGRLERRSEVAPVGRRIGQVRGVVAVDNRLDYVWQDAEVAADARS
ncbi:CBS domain-containing protein [Amycolatopsis sp. YIM 10]|uniref:CBS domain-containing protein n=1 Tax=Amycolatopsis sp. YIM 10 TaxID=2653857 RepID=UPI0012903C43|nr:CBS domain-containing protein [Amycolatopsis sp. YIM 10]QFU89939.1 putative voltage-gated ClC-type chloride channel ClcB [Amycolatopsis sp. YIM 10]